MARCVFKDGEVAVRQSPKIDALLDELSCDPIEDLNQKRVVLGGVVEERRYVLLQERSALRRANLGDLG